MPPRNSKFAIFSGYEMSRQDFKEFVLSLPSAREAVDWDEPNGLEPYLFGYNAFRRRLPLGMKGSAPKLRLRYVSKEAARLVDTDIEPTISRLFFPIRFVRYKGREQLRDPHPDSKLIKDETLDDKAKLNSFVQFIESCGGNLDPSKVSFAYMKELHPAHDWRTVRFLSYVA
ncbi:hypothetical protein PLEOSDRAFT_1102673 [Pleurotus ostreatus PC15]|uniref:Uncharacterized protein n=1 Tax=Pleurotus ostreatus (strain PC15) TaxID=1137138 RepID=A0A067NKM5_PLEO1|nr:hypothetical protein PLEOSDRAFT_1102673 [Pleurotus ostreatus PC15]